MRKHNYVVGFQGERQAIYGNDFLFTMPITFRQAQRNVKSLSKGEKGDTRQIYRLVEVRQRRGLK